MSSGSERTILTTGREPGQEPWPESSKTDFEPEVEALGPEVAAVKGEPRPRGTVEAGRRRREQDGFALRRVDVPVDVIAGPQNLAQVQECVAGIDHGVRR